ncbi:MAG: protoporphyrinogen oxidase [Myxococcota bacterium]
MAEQDRIDVLVVGGGLAGLTAALELQAKGRRVLVVDEATRLGGKAGSTHTRLGEFPTGPTSFNGRVPSFWRLFSLLGLPEEEVVRLHPASSARFIVRGGKLRALEPNPFSVMFTGALTFGEKWALVREFLFPRQGTAPDHDESMHELLVRRFGASAVEHFFSAVFTGIFAGDLRKLSAQACMPALVTAEKEYGSVLKGALKGMGQKDPGSRPGLYTFRQGFGVLGQYAEQKLSHRLGARVTSLALRDGGVTATLEGGGHVEAGAVVLATEADVAARLLAAVRPEAAAVLAGFRYAPIALVQWAERAPGEAKLPAGFGFLAAPAEQLFSLGSLFVGDLRGEPPRRFSTFVGGALQAERAALPDAELIEGVGADLTRLTGGALGEVVNIVRWPRAVFQPDVGHLGSLAALEAAMAGLPIALAGSYLGGAAMKDAIAGGFAAAARLETLGAPAAAPVAVAALAQPAASLANGRSAS